jgi:hypothetical protein
MQYAVSVRGCDGRAAGRCSVVESRPARECERVYATETSMGSTLGRAQELQVEEVEEDEKMAAEQRVLTNDYNLLLSRLLLRPFCGIDK